MKYAQFYYLLFLVLIVFGIAMEGDTIEQMIVLCVINSSSITYFSDYRRKILVILNPLINKNYYLRSHILNR